MSPKGVKRLGSGSKFEREEVLPRAPLPKGSIDDMEIEYKKGKKLNKYHKVILSLCLTLKGSGRSNIVCLNQCDSIFDLDKNQIERVKERLDDIKRDLSRLYSSVSEYYECKELGTEMFDEEEGEVFVNVLLANGFRKQDFSQHVLVQSLFDRNLKGAVRDIEKFLGDYKEELEKIRSRDIEDSSKFIKEVNREFERLKGKIVSGKATISDFDALADQFEKGMVTDDFNRLAGYYSFRGDSEFNEFLKNRNVRAIDPKEYARLMTNIASLRTHILARSKTELAEERKAAKGDYILYRFTSVKRIFGMLEAANLIPGNYIERLRSKYKKKIREEIKEKEKEIERLEDQLKKAKALSERDDLGKSPSKISRKTDSENFNDISYKIYEVQEKLRDLGNDQRALDSTAFPFGDGNHPKKWRSIEVFDEVVGEVDKILRQKPIIYDSAFLSTSVCEGGVNGFWFGGNELKITCRPGSVVSAANIEKFSKTPYEMERLFVPNAQFKVIGHKLKKHEVFRWRFEIDLEALPPKGGF